jgi:asparagine synthase (glutamine-hydrolysing)
MSICGIAVENSGKPVTVRDLEAMASSLQIGDSRGHNIRACRGAGFATTSATQTESAIADDALLVAFDGDLYNQPELWKSLGGEQSPRATTELISKLYLQHGISFLELLRGAFSMAVWDKNASTLVLARDRFGIRPLCYSLGPSEIVFASYPRGILASGRVSTDADVEAMFEYINCYVIPSPRTAFQNIVKINPGEYLIWKDGHARTVRYWEMTYPENAVGSTEQLAEDLLHQLEDSVRITSRGLDPSTTGCYLSGGTDSSSIVGLLTKINGGPTNTFSIGFTEDHFNELAFARIAAQQFKSNHHELTVRPADALDAIPKIAAIYDEPFGNSSAMPSYCCARFARERGMKVLLGGDGGDELFGGNERYRTSEMYALYHKLPAVVRRLAIEPIAAGLQRINLMAKVQRHIERAHLPNPDRYAIDRFVQEFPLNQILGPAIPQNGDRLATVRRHYAASPASSELNRLLYIDIKMTIGDEDVPKVVRTAELAGINARFPYLDQVLAELSGRIPAKLKVHGLKQRYIFKMATKDLLPAAILGKRKHGFGIPIGVWLKTEPALRAMSQDVLLDPRTYQRGYFRKQFVQKLIESFDRDNTPFSRYYGELLYVLLILELWHRQHVDAGKPVYN